VRVSIRARLTFWFSLVSFCGMLVVGLIAFLGLRSTMNKVVDNELSSRLDGLDDFLAEHLARLPIARVQSELTAHVALKPAFVVVQLPNGEFLYCGNSVKSLCSGESPRALRSFSSLGSLRILAAERVLKGIPLRIRIASDLTFQLTIMRQFSFWLLLVAPLALLSSTLGGYWLSGRALRPVGEIIEAVHLIGEHSLSLRLKVPATGDEIQHLSETLNGMLNRVETAFRRVAELTANASHELRTPICIIRTAAEIALLNARPTVESHRQALLQVCAEAEKNTRLLEDMLLLARSDSGSQTTQFSALPLAKTLRHAVEACRHLAAAKSITLSLLVDRSEELVWADASQLNRLWFLLLDNAIKYTPYCGNVTARILSGAKGEIIGEIADSGIGIDPQDQPLIFDRFFRAENARLTADTGSGLGLAIARWITEANHAQIAVDSSPGCGSTFRVTFPRQRATYSHNDERSDASKLHKASR